MMNPCWRATKGKPSLQVRLTLRTLLEQTQKESFCGSGWLSTAEMRHFSVNFHPFLDIVP